MATSSAALSSILSQIFSATGTGFAGQALSALSWRPPQWSTGLGSALFGNAGRIGLAGSSLAGALAGAAAAPLGELIRGKALVTMLATSPNGDQTVYIFDAVIRAEHERRMIITQNPVQDTAPITDHAYVAPASVTCEILMSDAMQAFILGQWADDPSKSVSAYQKLMDLQSTRTFLQIATRLRVYNSMLVASLSATETQETRYGMRAVVTFQEVLTATIQSTVTSTTSSIIPQVTGSTVMSQVQTAPIPAAVTTQNYTGASSLVSGAGNWSSFNLGAIG